MTSLHFTSKGEGQPLIFIHGFCETGEVWSPFVEKIIAGFKIVIIDLPGFGKSELPSSPFTIAEIAASVNNWVLEHHFENAILVGHSLGGYVALSMTKQNPELFAGLVLFHSTAGADSEPKRIIRQRTIDFVRANGVPAFTDSFVPGLYHVKDHPSVDVVKKIAAKTPESTFIAYTQAMRDRPESTEVLRDGKTPVLILAGDNDPVLPVDTLVEQVSVSRGARLQTVARVGHMGMYEAPDAFCRLINSFISGLKTEVRE